MLTSNLVGAVLTFFYFYNLQSVTTEGLEIRILILIGLSVIGNRVSSWYLAPLWTWYLADTNRDQAAPPRIRQLALNMPVINAGITMGLWVLAGLVFGLLVLFEPSTGEIQWGTFFLVLLGSAFIAGRA